MPKLLPVLLKLHDFTGSHLSLLSSISGGAAISEMFCAHERAMSMLIIFNGSGMDNWYFVTKIVLTYYEKKLF
jgi:hypothetical protein